MSEKSAAVLTVNHPDVMTPQGRREIAAWLRRQAYMLVRDGDQYASRFTARYLYREAADETETG